MRSHLFLFYMELKFFIICLQDIVQQSDLFGLKEFIKLYTSLQKSSFYYIQYKIIKNMRISSSTLAAQPSAPSPQGNPLIQSFLNHIVCNRNIACLCCYKPLHSQRCIYSQGRVICIGCYSKEEHKQSQKIVINLGMKSQNIKGWTFHDELQFILKVQENGIYYNDINSAINPNQNQLSLDKQHYIDNILLKKAVRHPQESIQPQQQTKNKSKIKKEAERKKISFTVQMRRMEESLKQTDEDVVGNQMIANINEFSCQKDRQSSISYLKHKNIKKAKTQHRIKKLLQKCSRRKAQIGRHMSIPEAFIEHFDIQDEQQFKMRQMEEQANKIGLIYDQIMDKYNQSSKNNDLIKLKAEKLPQKKLNLDKSEQKGAKSRILQNAIKKIKIKMIQR